MTNYHNGLRWRQMGHNGPPGTTKRVSCNEPQLRQTEAQEAVMKCKGNVVTVAAKNYTKTWS